LADANREHAQREQAVMERLHIHIHCYKRCICVYSLKIFLNNNMHLY
jgi:hypothetical protein